VWLNGKAIDPRRVLSIDGVKLEHHAGS